MEDISALSNEYIKENWSLYAKQVIADRKRFDKIFNEYTNCYHRPHLADLLYERIKSSDNTTTSLLLTTLSIFDKDYVRSTVRTCKRLNLHYKIVQKSKQMLIYMPEVWLWNHSKPNPVEYNLTVTNYKLHTTSSEFTSMCVFAIGIVCIMLFLCNVNWYYEQKKLYTEFKLNNTQITDKTLASTISLLNSTYVTDTTLVLATDLLDHSISIVHNRLDQIDRALSSRIDTINNKIDTVKKDLNTIIDKAQEKVLGITFGFCIIGTLIAIATSQNNTANMKSEMQFKFDKKLEELRESIIRDARKKQHNKKN